jgi:hypothetical protein
MARKPADPSWRLRGARFLDVPEPGFYRTRMVRGGPWVPCLIWVDCPFELEDEDNLCCPTERRLCAGKQLWSFRASINGTDADPLEVWQRGYRITPRQYHKMVLVRDRALQHARHEPEANPTRAVDLARQPSLF